MHKTVSDFELLRTRVYHVEGMTKYVTTIAHQATPSIKDIDNIRDVNILWKWLRCSIHYFAPLCFILPNYTVSQIIILPLLVQLCNIQLVYTAGCSINVRFKYMYS